jgi:DNA polymerase II small subunit/DNA polymerase delta subunit B
MMHLPNTTAATDLGRTIAPIKTPEPLDIRLETTSLIGRKAISVNKQRTHQVIFSFITTSQETAPAEGKMSDITSCFSDRLQSIRKMIIQNHDFHEHQQKYLAFMLKAAAIRAMKNKAVAIGLVNEPRYTKNGHLIWSLEDETGELTCLLTKRKGDDRDRAHEQILEAGTHAGMMC